jgi:hypothetical protein
MYSNPISNGPVLGGGYVPYFYQSGRFMAYSLAAKNIPAGMRYQHPAVYDFTFDLNQPRKHFHGPTVEQIIAHGYLTIPRSDSETALISDQKETSWLGLDDIIGQIRHRQQIYERNIYDLELAKCSSINAILALEAERGSVPADSRESYSLNKRLQDLYQQQRDERVKLWQDISRLRQTLPETAQQYLTAYRKVLILEEDSKGEGP